VQAGSVSGTCRTTFDDFHLWQQGTALSGCDERHEGLFTGTVEGRIMKLARSDRPDRPSLGVDVHSR